ncbi:MAG: FtsX-like permease family protein [Anaeroplasmataceae bacterium]|nr:FtsX-like permease family protein [Anaeroplasmataceae bacterium]MDE6414030.1 FtsX-like permease family protein [Anaeroplasmataceae bacterium]
MRKLFLIACSNMRKAKGQTVAIIVLILLAAMLLNLWLMLSMDYKANFDRYHDKLNAEHVTVTVDDNDGEVYDFLSQKIENDSRVSQYRLDRCLHMTASFAYNDGELSSWFIFMEKDVALSRSIGKAEIVEEENFKSGIYLPMIYKTNNIEVGKLLSVSIGSYTVEYTVCGFFNSVMAGSHNCGLTELILTEDKYDELETLGYAFKSTLCSIRLYDKSENVDFEADLKSAVSERFPNVTMVSNCYDIVVQARYISQMICSIIMSVMAFFVLLIALVVIISNIINYIQVNIKNLGALKAVGYTSKLLIGSLLFQFLGLALIVAIVGVGISYCLFPAVNKMMIIQTGIPYAIHFLPFPLFISIFILGGTVALVVWLASRRIKKIEPIVALRSGVQTHNFKHNHVPLEKTKTPLNFALALKTTLSGVKHNITICITMLVLSLVVVFSGLMTENVITDMTPFLNLIVGETANSCINVNIDFEDEFLQLMNADERVEKAYLYTTINVTHLGGAELLTTVCDDFSKLNNQVVVYKGRYPKYENEIAIGAKYAKERGLTVGNEIQITANGKTEKFLICGLTQVTNYLGRDGLLTREGYERLGKLSSTSYYINLVDGTDIDMFNTEIRTKFAESVNATINIDSTIDAVATVYVSLMTIIVIAILVLSAIIIAFVLYLLVRTMLNNKKRDYGILKSLGFTTKQLILQTALSFMPAILFSTIVGITISCIVINPLMSLFLSGLGIVKCTFAIPILFIIIVGALLVLFAFALLCLLSLKIKKISPYQILVGE